MKGIFGRLQILTSGDNIKLTHTLAKMTAVGAWGSGILDEKPYQPVSTAAKNNVSSIEEWQIYYSTVIENYG